MKKQGWVQKPAGERPLLFYVVVFLNIALLSGAAFLYGGYASAYQDRLWKDNLGNIANLNRSAAMNATTLITSWNTKLEDIARYMKLHPMSQQEALGFISDSNAHEDRHFQLISSDYTGFSANKSSDGTYPPLSYASDSYAGLRKAFDDVQDTAYGDIRFVPEFTDNETAVKFFATYKHVLLLDQTGQQAWYTLLLASTSQQVLGAFNSQNDYPGQSTVLIDPKGNYIVSNLDFKSTNFFQYLYKYNNLTLDETNAIQRQMEQTVNGELYYKNAGSVVEDCVFRYERMETNGWYCVTCVPISSFRAPAFNASYVVYGVFLLVALLVVDVSWLQFTNRRLRVSIQREMEASAAKGNFMSRMSHEIRTPLNAIIGYNTIARSELSDPKTTLQRKSTSRKVMDCLTKSDIASRHLLSIINDVLDMSAIESGKIKVAQERFDFKGLITSLTTIFYSQAKTKGVELDVVFDGLTEEWFVGDQMRVNQILTNLLSNAVKFTPQGGTVRLSIRQSQIEEEKAHIHFEVSDTGIGMKKEYLENIWTPFEQEDSSISRQYGGTGLGLSITKNLVELMGGTIQVESELDKGTTFEVNLTFHRTEQPTYAAAYDFRSINALVVDDDRCTCDYIAELFKHCCVRCTCVASGAAALEAFEDALHKKDPYTVCLVDWGMPEMDGKETIRRIRTMSPKKIPLIAITAYDFSEVAEEMENAGVSLFLPKPLFQSSLFDMLVNISGKAPPEKPKQNADYSFENMRVLLAEDNHMNMEIARRILSSAGLTVDSAWNGKEALNQFLNSAVGTYQAVLMDIHMPVMDGHEATRTIRASDHPEAKTIPIIAMTADAFAENVAEALAAGMNEHISKPIDVPLLFSILKKHIRK